MSKLITLFRIDGLEFDTDLGRGNQIRDNLFISNSLDYLKNDLKIESYSKFIGSLELQSYLTCSCYVYSKFEIEIDITNDLEVLKVLGDIKSEVIGFTSLLWLHIDNSVNLSHCFINSEESEINTIATYNDVGYKGTSRIKADSSFGKIKLTRSELKVIRDVYRDSINIVEYDVTGAFDKRMPRTSRALSLIDEARQTRSILKIPIFCSALESLFSRESQEITYKLSLRAAVFLRDDDEDPKDVYNVIKEIYKIRSKTIHGDYIKDNEVRKTIVKFDDILRKIFVKISYGEDSAFYTKLFNSSSDKEFNDYFDSLILS